MKFIFVLVLEYSLAKRIWGFISNDERYCCKEFKGKAERTLRKVAHLLNYVSVCIIVCILFGSHGFPVRDVPVRDTLNRCWS